MATSVQFSIRSLLIAMVVTAVGSAALTPIIRSWDTPARLHFVLYALVVTGLATGFLVYRCVARRRAERLAGEVILRASTQGNQFGRVQQVALLLLFLFGLFFLGASEAQAATVPKPRAAMFRWFNLAYLGWITSWLTTNCWWGTGPGIAELAENGLIERATHVTPYARFRTFRWNRYFRNTLVLSSRDYQLTQIVVPRWERERVERFLDEKGLISSKAKELSEDGEAVGQEQ
jgi:hypothetical protein